MARFGSFEPGTRRRASSGAGRDVHVTPKALELRFEELE
jgi:hypothetical protein